MSVPGVEVESVIHKGQSYNRVLVELLLRGR